MQRIFALLILTTALFAHEPIKPIPKSVSYNRDLAKLGKLLFFDPILSRNNSVSCASCHNFSHGGADNSPVSIGVYGRKGHMNSPTVLNAVFNFAQFWNGRAKDLKEQALGPLHNSVEMDMEDSLIMQRLQNSTLYQPLFQKLFHTSAITIDQVAIAIAEYEKSLITPDCKFDRFLRGETKLTEKEYNGYILFKKLGCATCHNGVNIGGNSYQKIGIFYPYKGKALDDRYKITKDPKDRYVYKVPTLRNIALTAPYFHDGSVKDLRNAIKLMAIYNLGVKLNDKQVDLLESFLLTLTGKVPTQ